MPLGTLFATDEIRKDGKKRRKKKKDNLGSIEPGFVAGTPAGLELIPFGLEEDEELIEELIRLEQGES